MLGLGKSESDVKKDTEETRKNINKASVKMNKIEILEAIKNLLRLDLVGIINILKVVDGFENRSARLTGTVIVVLGTIWAFILNIFLGLSVIQIISELLGSSFLDDLISYTGQFVAIFK